MLDPFDAVPVAEAPSAVPRHVAGETVNLLLELPGQPRLADPTDADHRDEPSLALFRCLMKELLDQAEFSFPSDERRLQLSLPHRSTQ
jgi:hypothetical protein